MTDLLILIGFLVAVAVIVRVDFIVYVAYVLAGVYALSRWYVPHSLAKLDAGRTYHRRAFLSETVQIEVRLANRSRLPILWLQLIESVPPELRAGPPVNHVLHLGPRRHRRLSYQVRAMKRGYYRLGPLNMIAGDLFGFKESQANLPPDFLTVYPRIVSLESLVLPSRLPYGTLASNQRLFEDPARPHGVREYRLGDSLRLVNWKVSAHSDTLLLRTHQPAISLETAILLNLNTDDFSTRFRLDGPEWAIVVAASLATHLVSRRQAVGLISNGADPILQGDSLACQEPFFDLSSGRLALVRPVNAGDEDASDRDPISATENIGAQLPSASGLIADSIPPRPGREHLMQVLERLARLEGAPTVAFAPFVAQATYRLNWGVTLLAVVPTADETLCDSLHGLVRAGFNVVMLVVERYADFASVQERARLLGFRAHHVPDDKALQSWLRSYTYVN